MEIYSIEEARTFAQRQKEFEKELAENIFNPSKLNIVREKDPRVTKYNNFRTYYNMYKENQILEKEFDNLSFRRFKIIKKYEHFALCNFEDENTYNFCLSYFDIFTQKKLKLYEKNRL